jgi:hypothetical protein
MDEWTFVRIWDTYLHIFKNGKGFGIWKQDEVERMLEAPNTYWRGHDADIFRVGRDYMIEHGYWTES